MSAAGGSMTETVYALLRQARLHRLPDGQVLAEIPGACVFEWWAIGIGASEAFGALYFVVRRSIERRIARR